MPAAGHDDGSVHPLAVGGVAENFLARQVAVDPRHAASQCGATRRVSAAPRGESVRQRTRLPPLMGDSATRRDCCRACYRARARVWRVSPSSSRHQGDSESPAGNNFPKRTRVSPSCWSHGDGACQRRHGSARLARQTERGATRRRQDCNVKALGENLRICGRDNESHGAPLKSLVMRASLSHNDRLTRPPIIPP